jgi:ribosomal protein L5
MENEFYRDYKDRVMPALQQQHGYKNVNQIPKVEKVVINSSVGSQSDIKSSLPRIRDFRGVSSKGFDGHGNYTLGVSDQSIFPEVELDKIKRNIGFDVTIVTTARTNDEAKSLLSEMGMPFSDRAKKLVAQPA